tara:strand:+ start:2459 stop:3631 length:1173 start_codon:yes stop_codon:yes gene_type:complete
MERRKLVVIVVMALVMFVACTPKEKSIVRDTPVIQRLEVDFSKESRKKIESYFNRQFKQGKFNGNVLVAVKDSVFQHAYGYANIQAKVPLTDSSKFQLASVSKMLTAYGTLLLVQEGKLALSDTVGKFLPDFPYYGVTIEQLLSHRSGLSNYMYVTDSAWADKEFSMCNNEAYDVFVEQNPMYYYPPDKRFDYCNTNYFLLAYIIERVTNLPFESYMAQEVFDPLEMHNTLVYTNMNYEQLPNIAVGTNGYGHPKPDFYLNGVCGDKGVYSTVADMKKFHDALVWGKVLNDSLTQLMYAPYSPFSSRGNSYGFGFRLRKYGNKTLIYHNGWWRGYHTYFLHFPEEDACIIVFSNTIKGGYLKQTELLRLLPFHFLDDGKKGSGVSSPQNS